MNTIKDIVNNSIEDIELLVLVTQLWAASNNDRRIYYIYYHADDGRFFVNHKRQLRKHVKIGTFHYNSKLKEILSKWT